MIRFSLIVPAYNIAPYIERCLDSLLKQDLSAQEYEIIVINDGSTDNTAEKILPYTDQYPHIRLFSTHNQGLGASRNYGLSLSQGQYIWMIDGDDWIAPSVLNLLYQEITRSDCQIIGIKAIRWWSDQKQRSHLNKKLPLSPLSGIDYMQKHNIYCGACMYLFQRSFLHKQQLLFTPGIYHEDEEFLSKCFLEATSVRFTKTMAYYYFQRSNSITGIQDPAVQKKRLADKLWIIRSLGILKEKLAQEDHKKGLQNKLYHLSKDTLISLVREHHDRQTIQETVEQLSIVGCFPLRPIEKSIIQRTFSIIATIFFQTFYKKK